MPGHHHHELSTPTQLGRADSVFLRRTVIAILLPLILLTLGGLILLWPEERPPVDAIGPQSSGVVTAVYPCVPPHPECQIVEFTALDGPSPGTVGQSRITVATGSKPIAVGADLWLSTPTTSPGTGETTEYSFISVKRTKPLVWLVIMFAAAVVLLSRWKGVAALVGLIVSLGIIGQFIIPALAQGESPLPVAAVGAAAIAIATMGLAHGFNTRTGTALFGTVCALLLTTALGALFTMALSFTGVGSEEAFRLQNASLGVSINLQGLFLAGLVIGALGVLDDVTVTQASTVWEVSRANPGLGLREVFTSGMRVGRDHVAATVNTLVLAYVGASLPLFLLLTLNAAPLEQTITGEAVAQEIVRSLVGGLGIVAAVPITTLAAAWIVTRKHDRDASITQTSPDSHHGEPDNTMVD